VLLGLLTCGFGGSVTQARASAPAVETLAVGFGKADITPDWQAKPVWIAGYGNNRQATGVHDPIMARTIVLRSGGRKIAIISLDLVGLTMAQTRQIRAELTDYAYVLTTSTHNHEGPDVIGLWGPSERETGVDPEYLALVVRKSVETVREAERTLRPVKAVYGSASDESLVYDSRLPIVKDAALRLLRFDPAEGGDQPAGLLVQWNCHPEHLGSKNTLLTADFPYYLIQKLEAQHGCPVVYLTGTVGGLLRGDTQRFPKPGGGFYGEGEFEFAEVQGEALRALADQALASAQPIDLGDGPVIASKPVVLPLANDGFRQARALGVLPHEAVAWTGDPYQPGPVVPRGQLEGDFGLLTEVAYLRLGELHIACIPGEIYPELVVGRFQDPVDPGADFPDAPLEPHVLGTLPGEKVLIVGLANDEVGYILPKRQWDVKPPYAYGKERPQYGEVNSVGPDTAPILMKALVDCVKQVQPRP
jgi:hypothetical protein